MTKRTILALGVGSVSFIFLLGIFILRTYDEPDTQPAPKQPKRSVELPKAKEKRVPVRGNLAPPSKSAVKREALQSVDLLPFIDPKKHAFSGIWKFYKGDLLVPSNRFARLKIPYRAPTEYDLEILVRRSVGSSSLTIGLVADRRPFAVVLDGFSPPRSGLDLVDGKPFNKNETTFAKPIFSDNNFIPIVCFVRKGSITVEAGGQRVLEWSGPINRLSLFSGWKTPGHEGDLFLGSWDSVFVVKSIRLTPITGKGEVLK